MLARLQQFITLSLFISAVSWAAWFIQIKRFGWAGGGALLIVFSYALFLAAEFILVGIIHGDDPVPRPTIPLLLRAWWGETLAAPRVFCWQQPFRSNQIPDLLNGEPGCRGVVLVHGFVCNRGFWNRWMQQLTLRNTPFVAVNLEPVFGGINRYAPIIEHAVRRIEAATGIAPILVGHSMGGLAIRAWRAETCRAERVHRIVTIGSPHRGTWLARFGMSRNSREMARGSAWQRLLEAEEAGRGFDEFTCFYSHCDNVVFPASNATLVGADNRHVVGAAHVQLVDHPAVFDEVVRLTQNTNLDKRRTQADGRS